MISTRKRRVTFALVLALILNTWMCTRSPFSTRSLSIAATSAARILETLKLHDKSIGDPYIVVCTSMPKNREFLIRVHPPARDTWLSMSLLNSGKVEENIAQIIQDRIEAVLSSGSSLVHVLDVGANIGFLTLFAATLDPRVRVTSIEPTPWHSELLQQSLELNPQLRDRVKLFNFGLSDSPGGSLCMTMEEENGAATSASQGRCAGKGSTVPVTTVDEILRKSWKVPVTIFKIDVEGFESRVFDGSKSTLREMQMQSMKSLVISEYVPFRLKRANPSADVYETFFQHFPSDFWSVSVVQSNVYDLKEGDDDAIVREAVKSWNEWNHTGGDLLLFPSGQ